MDICSLISCTGCETRVCDKVQNLFCQRSGESSYPWDSPGAAVPFDSWRVDVPGRAFGAFPNTQSDQSLGEPWVYLQLCNDLGQSCLALGEGSEPHWQMSASPLCQTEWKLVSLERFRSARWSWCREEMTEIKDVNTWTVLCCHPRCLPEGITPPPARSGPIPAPRNFMGCPVQLDCELGVKEISQREQVIGSAAMRY